MADSTKKERSKKPARATPLSEHEELSLAIESFLRENTNFESSVPVNSAVDAMAALTDIQEVFMLPLQRQLLNMDGALRWALFLALAPARAEECGDRPFSAAPFSADAAMALISSVYDLGVGDAVYAHFEEESDDESDASEKQIDEQL